MRTFTIADLAHLKFLEGRWKGTGSGRVFHPAVLSRLTGCGPSQRTGPSPGQSAGPKALSSKSTGT